MKPSLRETLVDSHISAVAIAALLIWSLHWGFLALWEPLSRIASFLFTGVAILGIPYFSFTFNIENRMLVSTTLMYLFNSLATLAAAWLLSRWAYGVGPLRSLRTYRNGLAGSEHV